MVCMVCTVCMYVFICMTWRRLSIMYNIISLLSIESSYFEFSE